MINYNGDLISPGASYLTIQNRGFRFGDLIEECVRFSGDKMLFWEEHYFRIMASIRQLRMEIPMTFTMEYLEAQVMYTLTASALATRPASIHIWLYRNSGVESENSNSGVGFIIEAQPIGSARFTHHIHEKPVDLYKDYFIYADNLASLSFVAGPVRTLAKIYADENDCSDMILLSHEKEVCELLGGTVFFNMGNTWVTPSESSGCRSSVLRKEILKMWPKFDFEPLEVRPISPFEIQKADEIFSLNESSGFLSVSQYRKTFFKTDKTHQLVNRVNAALFG